MRSARAAEVAVDCFDARCVVAELRPRRWSVQDEIGGGAECEVRGSETLAEGAVAAGGREVAFVVEDDVGGVGYEAGDMLVLTTNRESG